jgi:hypothetical protein
VVDEAVDHGGGYYVVAEGLAPANRGWDMFRLENLCCCLAFSGLSRFCDL